MSVLKAASKATNTRGPMVGLGKSNGVKMDYGDLFDEIERGAAHMLHSKINDGLNEILGALDRVEERCDPNDEVFAKIYIYTDEEHYYCCHLAVVKRSCTGADDARLEKEGWSTLGKVADHTSAKVKRLERDWGQGALRRIHAFKYQKWAGKVSPDRELIAFDVSVPVQLWDLVDYYKDDTTGHIEEDWATFTGVGGCVHFAYLQILPYYDGSWFASHLD